MRNTSIKAMVRPLSLAASLLLTLAFTGCGGGDSSSSSTTSSGGNSSGGSASSCNYTDLISSSERAQANSCGIQVSGNFGMADSHLQQVIEACKRGLKSEADKHYNDVYKTAVEYARNVARQLDCGGSGGAVLPTTPSTQTYYNLCIRARNNTREAVCAGPYFKNEAGCGTASGYTYLSQHTSDGACQTAGKTWLNSQ